MAKEAFCLVMWRSEGGLVDSEGKPTGPPVQGLCDNPEDCGKCGLLQATLAGLGPDKTYLWVCPDCADRALTGAKHWKIRTQAPGYYSSGLCQRPQCQRADKYSNFLQLLIVVGDRVP